MNLKIFLCIRKRVLLGCCIPNFIILFALIKISEIQAEWGASHGRNNFFQNMKKEPNKRVHTKFHGSRWKINNCLTIIKRVAMRRQLPTEILNGKVLRSTRTHKYQHTNVSSCFMKSMRPYERNLNMQARRLPHLFFIISTSKK